MTPIERRDRRHAAFLFGIESQSQRRIRQDCVNAFTAMLRLSALVCATLLVTAPAFAGSGGCQRSQTSADAGITEQKQDAETQT